MSDHFLSFKEMCERFAVTPRTLRHYEQIEILAPERRGRARFYGPRELARMTLILRGRRFGFTLEEIRQWLLMYQEQGSRVQLQTFVTTADVRIAVLANQAIALQAAISDLRALREQAMRDMTNLPD